MNPYLQHGTRLHIKNGISSMSSYVRFTEEELFLVNQLDNGSEAIGEDNFLDTNYQAEQQPRNIESIVRNQALVRKGETNKK